jgi:hypothetical protein
MEFQKKSRTSNKFFTINLLILFFIGITLCNILHFYIEDAYNLALVPTFFFGPEYAINLAWMLVLLPPFIILSFAQYRIIQQHPDAVDSSWRKKILTFLSWLSIVMSVPYIVGIVYTFLSGRSDVYGLMRAGINLGLIILGFVYVWTERRCTDFIKKALYPVILNVCIVILGGIGMAYSLPYGSPYLMQTARKDLQKISDIKELSENVKSFVEKFKRLPRTIDDLLESGLVDRELVVNRLKDIQNPYEIVRQKDNNVSVFKICAHFETESKDARRLEKSRKSLGSMIFIPKLTDPLHYEKGLQCFFFTIETKPDGKSNLRPSKKQEINMTIQNFLHKAPKRTTERAKGK